ncbi:ribosome-associated heat shock protein Hsp15 [Dysgonomonas sp. PFB1-18]|uniref:RNA-binding S4 domain-containing protein n=1 Tax=unclassified Dysgonomonas TaxID=2630389 RepID=UPI002476939E|nr:MULTISPECIES: RNA-binding S4 domain-containing protein [unclassified Dysgonomonas]MDH6309130.1 ribosome-associated heat shock protein Hsp15 [Dysgonomonas sp. PF1-14]MDH6338990.1 ribosome-associated heat shock protein Hsp15 [Dysgonomonas sp. PF1-16]MDH6380379.1 ribosome-associated heat shock protein Hsp15 [Dysgonomonas sp. PFB1-18]MDH6397818.1 ribosome-associated heat shock protein Hsp15 [Dysgonomonas sp. PF1-23]
MAKEPKNEVRIDKWLWAVRLFKTRSIAIEACKKGRISIKGVTIKPARMIKVGDIIEVRRAPITYSFEVLNLTENRMGAKLVPDFMKDVTPPSQLEILELSKMSGFVDRARGTGRPTKKDRRELEEFREDYSFFDDWDFDNED